MPAALTFEAVAAAYFAVIGLAAAFMRAPRARRVRVTILGLAAAIAVLLAVRFLTSSARLWLGHAYLAAGYWIPALLVSAGPLAARTPRLRGTRPTFEAWLVRSDRRCPPVIARIPAWALLSLELSYLLCYVLVPAAFVVIWLTGTADDGDRFWTAVLVAGYVCYGTLPWLVARPPRVVEGVAARGIARMNVYVLGRVSHGFNTFPSGHVAVSLAAALEVVQVSGTAGAALTLVAAAIAAGAIAGRYHYAVDVLLGLVIGLAAFALGRL